MKARYIVALVIIILATILFEYLMLAHPIGDSPKLGNTIQAAAVFVALVAAVAAVAASDPKSKQVNVGMSLTFQPAKPRPIQRRRFQAPLSQHSSTFRTRSNPIGFISG